ncbi:MAG: 3-hydroxyacyl-CoA dehydrogenase NAD-binding domain-containing protein [Acidimicrobiales bacterium]
MLWIEGAGPAQNVFSATLADALDATLERVERERRPLVIASAKAHSFLAGADVEELAELADGAAGAARSARAQRVMDRVAALPVRTVAAISGACLGAGLELALACRVRLAAERADTRLGLPDVALGLVPGAGARGACPARSASSPRWSCWPAAASSTRRGRCAWGSWTRRSTPTRCSRPPSHEPSGPPAARRRRAGLAERARTWLLEANPVGRAVVLARAEREAHVRSQGLLPAPLRAVQVVRAGQRRGRRAGLAAESHAFGELAVTRQARSLMFLFLAHEAAELTGVGDKTRPVAKVAVIGAGLTGAGIAEVTAHEAKLPVRLRDLDRAALAEALRTIRRRLDGRRSVSLGDATRVLDRITTTTGRSGFGDADLVIEAVADELDVKRQVLSELETLVADTAVLATTTSSRPVRELAAALALPARLVGMHYVSPVGRSPLLEVVAGPATAPDVVATAVALGRAQGRTVIVVRDGPGFYTSRVLGRWLAVAAGLRA